MSARVALKRVAKFAFDLLSKPLHGSGIRPDPIRVGIIRLVIEHFGQQSSLWEVMWNSEVIIQPGSVGEGR